MMKWMRTRLAAIVAVLLVVFVVTGCGGTKEEAKKPEAAPATAQATPAPAPAPQVDKAAVIKEAVVNYFNTLPPNSNMMEPADVLKKVEAKDATVQYLDIRKAEDFAKGHIPGALNIPMADVGKNIDKIAKDKQVIVMCYSGQTSGQTVAALKLVGINAISLKGGFPAYEKVEKAIIEK